MAVVAPGRDRTGREHQSFEPPKAVVLAAMAVGVAGIGVLAWQAYFWGSANLVQLELAGGAHRASVFGAATTPGTVGTAVIWDFGLVVGYLAVLWVAAQWLAPRAFRVRSWRVFSRSAVLATVVAAVLNVVADVAILYGVGQGSSTAELAYGWEWPWVLAAVLSWAKFVMLALVAGYVLVAVFAYAATPLWVQELLMHPPQASPPKAQPMPARFGIAVAGGGVRSAALALGGLQALHERFPAGTDSGPSWSTADKVTAVSGGAYMAGAWSVARSTRLPPPKGQPHQPAADAWKRDSPEEHHLLERLGYLLAQHPTGDSADARGGSKSDVPGVVSTLVAGLLLNATLLFSLLWLAIQPLAWVVKSETVDCGGYASCSVDRHTLWPGLAWLGLGLLALLLWVAAGWARSACQPGTAWFRLFDTLNERLRGIALGLVGLGLLLSVLLVWLPLLVDAAPGWERGLLRQATPVAIVSAIGLAISSFRVLKRSLTRFAPFVGAALLGVLGLALTVIWISRAEFGRAHLIAYAIIVGLWLVGYPFLSSEWWSMAPFYRGKLRGGFATYRDGGSAVAWGNGNEPPEEVEPSIYELDARSPQRPDGSPLQICTTANVAGRRSGVKTHYGMPALSMTLSPTLVRLQIPEREAGAWSSFECSARDLEALSFRRGGSRLTTMMEVGISGAAVAPAMGKFRIGPAGALITLLNVRLGVWVPNPKYVANWPAKPPPGDRTRPTGPQAISYPRPRIGYLLKEFFGIHDLDDLYLYCTDGGHWENTGLVELTRDHDIVETVCLDADAGPGDTLSQLASAVVLAGLEHGTEIDIDLDPLRAPHAGRRGSDYAQQSVAVGLVRRGAHIGLLWYCKPALVQQTPVGLLSYGETDLSYPAVTTLDQFFHTAQFKAYRDLGTYNGRQLVIARTKLAEALSASSTFQDFVTRAKHPDAHWALMSLAQLLEDRPQDFARLKQVWPV